MYIHNIHGVAVVDGFSSNKRQYLTYIFEAGSTERGLRGKNMMTGLQWLYRPGCLIHFKQSRNSFDYAPAISFLPK